MAENDNEFDFVKDLLTGPDEDGDGIPDQLLIQLMMNCSL